MAAGRWSKYRIPSNEGILPSTRLQLAQSEVSAMTKKCPTDEMVKSMDEVSRCVLSHKQCTMHSSCCSNSETHAGNDVFVAGCIMHVMHAHDA